MSPATAPVTIRASGVLDLKGHQDSVAALTMDCGNITGAGTLTCTSLDWYGGSLSLESKIVVNGPFRKHAGSLTALPANISCSGPVSMDAGAQKPASKTIPAK